MFHKLSLAASVLVFSFSAFANNDTSNIDKNLLNSLSDRSLQFILNDQIKLNNSIYLKGEWPQNVEFTGPLSFLRITPTEKVEDPSAFTTASILNILLSAYPDGFTSMPVALQQSAQMAVESFSQYKIGKAYHFFPRTYVDHITSNATEPLFIHQSRLVRMKGSTINLEINNGTLVPPDADTTSVVRISKYKVLKENFSPETLDILNQHRDTKRLPHLVNILHGHINTGAFMTWLQSEPNISPLNIGKIVDYTFKSIDNKYRLPLAKNDVDCVVNTNVIRALAITKNTQHEGYAVACAWINKNLTDKNSNSCGVYYPNTFHLHYVVSSAQVDGASCLMDSNNQMVKDLLAKQEADGSWRNKANIEVALRNPDPIQTTLYALMTYINIYKSNKSLIDEKAKESFKRGLSYILSRVDMSSKNNKLLNEGMFYSAFPPIRNNSAWRSPSYTMALAFAVFKQADLML